MSLINDGSVYCYFSVNCNPFKYYRLVLNIVLHRKYKYKSYITDAVCKGVINLNSGLALSVRLTTLESSQNILLAAGTDDWKIHLYTENNGEVLKLDSLAGHEDWVRSLDFTKDGEFSN